MYTHLRVAQALAADAPAASMTNSDGTVDWKAVASPMVGGFIIGLVVYSIARKVGVNENQSKGTALAVGAVTAIGQIASTWLKGWTDKAIAAAGLAPTATPPSTPSTPAPATTNTTTTLKGLWG